MRHTELRKFLLEANQTGLSPAEKDVFLYYQSRGRTWDCPDIKVAADIGRSRNSVCEARNRLKSRQWISEITPFQISVVKSFSVENATENTDAPVGNSTENARSPVGNSTERVGNSTERVGNSTGESETRLKVAVSDSKQKPLQSPKRNIEEKEVNKEEEEVADKPPSLSAQAQEVFDFWVTTMRKRSIAVFGSKRRHAVLGRLKHGYTVDLLKTAILGCSVTPHNQGQNASGSVYDDLELICRDEAHVDRFISNYHQHKVGKLNGTHNGNRKRTDADVIAESADFYANYPA